MRIAWIVRCAVALLVVLGVFSCAQPPDMVRSAPEPPKVPHESLAPAPQPTSVGMADATPTAWGPSGCLGGCDPAGPVTPAFPEPWEDPVLTMAYTRGGDLWLSTGYNAPREITHWGDVAAPLLSPDGGRILFRRGAEAHLAMDATALWVLDLAAEDARQIFPPDPEADAAGAMALEGRYPYRVAWLADGRHVAVSTASPVECGTGTHHDLWLADVEEGSVVRLLADGEGGALAPSPTGNTILAAGTERVALVEADSGAQHELLRFSPVNTSSEWAYTPRPLWLPDGTAGLVAVTSPDPWAADATCALWRLSAVEGAVQLGALPVSCLYDTGEARLWSPDGSRLAYIDEAAGYLMVAAGDGSGAEVYTTNVSQFLGWSADGTRFALRIGEAGDIHIGEMGAAPVLVADPLEVGDVWDLLWLDDGTLVYTTGPFDAPTLWVSEPGAEPRVIDDGIGGFGAGRFG